MNSVKILKDKRTKALLNIKNVITWKYLVSFVVWKHICMCYVARFGTCMI